MQIRSLLLLFEDPSQADQARAELERGDTLKRLKIEQAPIALQSPKVRPQRPVTPSNKSSLHHTHIAEFMRAVLRTAIPAFYASRSAQCILCFVSDASTNGNLLRVIDAALPPGTSALVLQRSTVVDSPAAGQLPTDSTAVMSQGISREEFQVLLEEVFGRTRTVKGAA